MIPQYSIPDFFETKAPMSAFHINRLEEMPPLPSSIKSPHKHLFIEVFLVLEGEMEHNVDFRKFNIAKGNLFFISQGQFHLWAKNHTEKIHGFRLMFEERFLESFHISSSFLFELIHLTNLFGEPLCSFSLNEHQRMIQLFELINEEYERNDRNEDALRANLFLLLLEIKRIAADVSTEKQSHYHLQIFQRFCSLVELQYSQNFSASYFADKLHVTPVQLNRIVTKFAHTSTLQYILNRRMLEAKRLLTVSQRSIQEIAFDIGFEDSSYFARIFRKQVGITPNEFRLKR
jgi:AraC-like DNA-binding protein